MSSRSGCLLPEILLTTAMIGVFVVAGVAQLVHRRSPVAFAGGRTTRSRRYGPGFFARSHQGRDGALAGHRHRDHVAYQPLLMGASQR
jgi:hypothetical protein